MKKFICTACGAMMLLFMMACHDKKAKNYNNDNDDPNGALFIKNGIEGGLTEIKASGLAITNSNNQQVIGLAKRLIEDHTKIGEELIQLEKDRKIEEKDTINLAHQQMLNDLSKKSGAAFDKAYLQMMVLDHQQAVKLFATATTNSDSKVKNIATEYLPEIKMHLDSANAICINLK